MTQNETPQIIVPFATVDQLQAEYDEHLVSGGTFLPGEYELQEQNVCVVVLVHPEDGESLSLSAMVVWVSTEAGNPGIGVALSAFGPELREDIRAFIQDPRPTVPVVEKQPEQHPEKRQGVHERLRGISPAMQIKVAREGTQEERITLERMYGKTVWEPLLRNPRITPPEVARIAKMGALPQPLIDIIVANRTWLAGAIVRRALLTNPRLRGELVTKVLRAAPKSELKLIPQQTAYPAQVREAARKLLNK